MKTLSRRGVAFILITRTSVFTQYAYYTQHTQQPPTHPYPPPNTHHTWCANFHPSKSNDCVAVGWFCSIYLLHGFASNDNGHRLSPRCCSWSIIGNAGTDNLFRTSNQRPTFNHLVTVVYKKIITLTRWEDNGFVEIPRVRNKINSLRAVAIIPRAISSWWFYVTFGCFSNVTVILSSC